MKKAELDESQAGIKTAERNINNLRHADDTTLMAESEEELNESRSVMSDSLQSHELYSPWNSPGQNTGVGSLSLLQRIFNSNNFF